MFGRRKQPDPLRNLGDECEAFLAGRAAEGYLGAGLTPPVWAQLNRFARGTLDEVRALDRPPRRQDDADEPWDSMNRRLARVILAQAPTEDRLRALQVEALWPLESELIDARSQLVTQPGQLYRVVVAALDDETSRR